MTINTQAPNSATLRLPILVTTIVQLQLLPCPGLHTFLNILQIGKTLNEHIITSRQQEIKSKTEIRIQSIGYALAIFINNK
jgi:hypothetical protein